MRIDRITVSGAWHKTGNLNTFVVKLLTVLKAVSFICFWANILLLTIHETKGCHSMHAEVSNKKKPKFKIWDAPEAFLPSRNEYP